MNNYMPSFNSNAYIATQLRFVISFSFSIVLFLLLTRTVILFWLGPDQVFSDYKIVFSSPTRAIILK